MPELPEVETMRRGVAGVVRQRIQDVQRLPCRLKPIVVEPAMGPFRQRAIGRRIAAAGRIGKRVVLSLETGDSLVFEPRMTGLLLLADPPDLEHLRFRITFGGGPVSQLLYWDRRGLGSVRLWSADELEENLTRKLGPDALALTDAGMRSRLAGSRRAIKVALLDQARLAGIGNLYASEILHVARLHPAKPCCDLSAAQWRRLHAATCEVLTAAVRYEGSTLGDGTYRNALNRPGRFQQHHRVYGRAGQSCKACRRGVVRRVVQAQRATFFCPRCQRAARATK